MTTFLSPEDLARRTAAAVDAAVGAGRGLGLEVTDAAVLHDVFSVVVHLAPAPVVARIPTVLPPSTDPATLTRRQRSEVDVAGWLAEHGTPVIPPSSLVPREPVRRNGFSMTFWEFVAEDRTVTPDYAANSELTAELHAALREYPGPLTFLSSAEPEFVTESLAVLADYPERVGADDLDRARREWRILEPLVRSRAAFENAFPGVELQPIHGDSPPANVFPGVDGYRFSDFELVTLGPVEWDLAGLGPELEAAYNRGAERHGLRTLREDVLGFANAVGMLRAIAVLTLAPQLPAIIEYVKPALDQWRAMPFAGGVR